MKLSEICIQRPVFATVLSLILILFGFIGYDRLETQYFPTIQAPTAEVSVSLPGATPELMQSSVTQFLQNALVNVDNLKNISSTSRYNDMSIYLTFDDGTNMIKALAQVRDQVDGQLSQLPASIEPPSVTTGGVDRPVLNIGFMDSSVSSDKIRDYLQTNVVPLLRNLHGVGAVWLYGASSYAMRIWLDPQKMAALGVTVSDVENTLNNNNIDFSGGSIRGAERTYAIESNTRLTRASQFADLIIRDNHGQVVRLKDVATVEKGSNSLSVSPMRINQKNAIDMEIRPLKTANPISVAAVAKKELAIIKKRLPPGMTMLVTYDQSKFLKAGIDESFKTIFEAILLVILVVLGFLGSVRAAIIPIATIPVCIIAVFGVMLLFGYSINVMTLLAIILAIGLVVDDAIVMLENIYRHVENGLTPMKAALVGSKEIGFAVIAMTLTLAAVYAPTGFVQGFTAKVFQEFAFTLAGAVLISGFVALTLSPMMCSRMLRPAAEEGKMQKRVAAFFARIENQYRMLLHAVLRKPLWTVGSLVLLAILSVVFYLLCPQSFIPKEDIGYFTVGVNSPPGSTVHYTDYYMKRLEALFADTKQIKSFASFISPSSATEFVTMVPWYARSKSTQQVINELKPQFDSIPGITIDASVPDPINYGGNSDGSAVQLEVMSLGSYYSLAQTMNHLVKILRGYPGLQDVKSDLKFNNQVYQLSVNREVAANLGISPQDVANTVSVLMSGKHITNVFEGAQVYPVQVQMNLHDLANFTALNDIYVRSNQNANVPLTNLISIKPAVRQTELHEYDRQHSAMISANLSNGYSLGTVVDYLKKTVPHYLGQNENYAFGGRIAVFLQSNGKMLSLFALSVIFIYLVLAAQFESFVDPFIILLTVPLSIVGTIGTLIVVGGSLNLYTNIGLITLVGLITKHGILITQFVNDELKKGKSLIDSIIEGSVTRLRPILMTTMAMVLGSLPLAFASGPGSIAHEQIGWVIVGGMMFGTIFSLFIVPVAYYYFAPLDYNKRMRLSETIAKKSPLL